MLAVIWRILKELINFKFKRKNDLRFVKLIAKSKEWEIIDWSFYWLKLKRSWIVDWGIKGVGGRKGLDYWGSLYSELGAWGKNWRDYTVVLGKIGGIWKGNLGT